MTSLNSDRRGSMTPRKPWTPANAARSYREGLPGWYVINRRTKIAVAGPYDAREDAAAYAHWENRNPPVAPDQLVVAQVREG